MKTTLASGLLLALSLPLASSRFTARQDTESASTTLAAATVETSGAAAPDRRIARHPATAETPGGLFAVIEWNAEPAPATWNNNLLDGVVIRTFWRDLNPREGEHDWAYLDRQFENARRHRKRIHLMVAPGFYSPSWVLHARDVETAPFDIPAGPHAAAARKQPLPLPWNRAYLDRWFHFVDALAMRYRDHEAFGWISVTGPNSHNGEISLPRRDRDEGRWLDLAGGDAHQLRSRLTEAWEKTIDRFCRAFHGRHVTLAIIAKSLPIPVGTAEEKQYMEELAAHGAEHDASTFGLQTNGLDGRPLESEPEDVPAQWDMVGKYGGRILTGFQTRAPANLNRGGRRATDANRRRDIMRQTLLVNGLSRRPDFIEVYERDANDPELREVMSAAAKELRGP